MNNINQFNSQTLLSQFKQRKANSQTPHSTTHFTSNLSDASSSNTTDNKKSNVSKKKIVLYSLAALSAATLVFLGFKKGASKINMKQRFEIGKEDFTKLEEIAEDTLGKDYVKNLMNAAGWGQDSANIKPNSFKKDFLDAILDIPGLMLDGINSAAKKINKNYTPHGILAKRAIHNEKANAQDTILNLVEVFKKVGCDKEAFKTKVIKNISNSSISYKTRNERALTRLTTGLVSTIFAGTDFYNISMLQKDDKKEAKRSAKTREKQEFSRYAMNAGFQFLTLGAFDRYVKNSIPLTVLVSGVTALFTEVVSRLFTHTPLTPLTPEQAKHVAEKRRAREAKKNNQTIKETKENNEIKLQNQPSFKASLNNQIVFKDFAKTDGSFASLELQKENIKNLNQNQIQNQSETKPKKKSNLGKILGMAFAGFSAFYIFSRTSKGSQILKNISNTLKLEKIKKALTTKERTIEASKLLEKINAALSDDSTKSADGRRILEEYKKILTDSNGAIVVDKITVEDNRLILGSIYSGFAKMGKTISAIFSLPGKLLCDGFNSLSKKITPNNRVVENNMSTIEVAQTLRDTADRIGEIREIFSSTPLAERQPLKNSLSLVPTTKQGEYAYSGRKTIGYLDKGYDGEYNDQFKALDKLFKKYGDNHKKLLEEITKRARSTKANGGTSIDDVAHNCRTIATGISTYFFVNDYRNKVLIESDGKDIDGASEQTNERIIHKLANFLINGTLMNLFNSTFKPIMNASIIAASGVSALTELCNESLVRFSICSPSKRMNSRQELLDFNEKQEKQGGLKGAYVRGFKKLTGKKNIIEKSGVKSN